MPSESLPRTMSATESVPFIYRVILLYIEPLLAAVGAAMTTLNPAAYAHAMTRGAVPFDESTTFLYTQLGGGWLYFSFVEAVVLRLYDDLKLWRVLCAGMLLSDIWYSVGTIQAVGGLGSWLILADWTTEDWTTLVTTLPMLLVRVLLVLGIGIKKAGSAVDSAKAK